jgi:hypothetical protein
MKNPEATWSASAAPMPMVDSRPFAGHAHAPPLRLVVDVHRGEQPTGHKLRVEEGDAKIAKLRLAISRG